MFADERFLVLFGAEQSGQVLAGADVAEDDADVAQEAPALDPEDGAAGEALLELRRADSSRA